MRASQSGFTNFITAKGDQLMDGDAPFRFMSWNIPNLLVVEDSLSIDAPNDWRIPNEFELRDALMAVNQLGGAVVRTYSVTVLRDNEKADVPKHVLGIGKFNEEMFRSFDMALKIANEQHVRLIIPLVNNWIWQGGREEYAKWRGKKADAFWTDPQIIADFEETIRFVLTRTNTLTGTRYLDDKAILCWETGNEVRGEYPAWTRHVASFIKKLDTNHLVMDGYDERIRPEVLDMPEIDIVTTHHYPSMNSTKTFAEQIRANAAMTKGKKPYFVGEFGFVKLGQMKEAIKAISETQCAGGMLWSLRFRNRDGGFYWHSEPDGAGLYKAFHWPGSPVGNPYDEQELVGLVREAAFKIRGLPVPSVPIPEAPVLLSINDVSAISWQGSVGASSYTIERADNASGPWTAVAENIDESFTQYHPMFADETAVPGKWFYRVTAKNASGPSAPSNISKPIEVRYRVLVDEMDGFAKTFAHTGQWKICANDTRKAREDIHRAAGVEGSSLVYKLAGSVESYDVLVFFPGKQANPIFSASEDGVEYHPVTSEVETHFNGAGDYGYWKAASYRANGLGGKARYLKIQLTGETQLSRTVIHYLPAP